MFGAGGEDLAERLFAGCDDKEDKARNERANGAFFDPAVFDCATATREVFHQCRQVNSIVDGAARFGEVSLKAERLREIEEVVVIVIMKFGRAPVVDP